MIYIKDLNETQKENLFGGNKCVGFWENTTGIQHKKTVFTIDNKGLIWKSTSTCTKSATIKDIEKLSIKKQ